MGLRVLLVDDERDIVEVIQDRLEAYGFTVVTAATSREALKTLARESFDGVFMDVKMPEVSGIEGWRKFAGKTRKSPSSSSRHLPPRSPQSKRSPKAPTTLFLNPSSGTT